MVYQGTVKYIRNCIIGGLMGIIASLGLQRFGDIEMRNRLRYEPPAALLRYEMARNIKFENIFYPTLGFATGAAIVASNSRHRKKSS